MSRALNMALYGVPFDFEENGVTTLASNAQDNGFTHLWVAEDYSVSGTDGVDDVGTLTDQISSITLSSAAGSAPEDTSESGVETLTFNKANTDLIRASFSYSNPYEYLILLYMVSPAGSSETIVHTMEGTSGSGLSGGFFNGGNLSVFNSGSASTGTLTATIDDQWIILYFKSESATTTYKVGANARGSASLTAASPLGFNIGARSNNTFPINMRFAAAALNTNGNCTDTQLNAVADYWQNTAFSALTPAWSAIT